MLGELRRGRAQDLAQHARLKFDQKPVDLGPGLAPHLQHFRVIAELNAGLGQNPVRRRLNPEQVFLGQHVIGRDIAQDIGPPHAGTLLRALCLPRLPP